MKTIFFSILSLILFSSAQAQTPTNQDPASQTRRVSSKSARTHSVRTQLQLEEASLDRLVHAYSDANSSQKDDLRSQVKATLISLFDLNIKVQEAEAKQLGDQLGKMETDDSYEEKKEQIQTLRTHLKKVEASISFRKSNRERIVNRRMDELLKENQN